MNTLTLNAPSPSPLKKPRPADGCQKRALSFAATGFAAVLAAVLWTSSPAHAADTQPAALLQTWSAQAGAPGNAARGQAFFTSKHGREWSCASCHGNPPTSTGKHASTGKAIDPMAPAFNPKALTDTARVDKWFRRNCNDVLARECSAGEKADVLAYLINLK